MASEYDYKKAMGFPSLTPEAKRERYARNRDDSCRRRRERYANDPAYRARRLAEAAKSYQRRKDRA